MSATTKASAPAGGLAFSNPNQVFSLVLRLFLLMLLNALGLIFTYSFLQDDNLGLALVFGIITIGADIIFLVPGLYPLRWMTPGFALMLLLVIYPLIYTVSTSLTNMGDGHLFTKGQAIDLITARGIVPEGATTYDWVAFRRGEGSDAEYALWLTDDAGNIEFALPDEPLQSVSLAEFGVTYTEDSDLPTIENYDLLTDLTALDGVTELTFDDPVGTVLLTPIDFDTRFYYDVDQQLVFDQEDGVQFNVSVLVNDAGDYGVWLLDASDDDPTEALVYLPTEGLDEIDLRDRDDLNDRNIDLSGDIAQTVDEFRLESNPDTEQLQNLILGELGDDYLQTATLNLDDRFVLDIEQGIALDRTSGDEFETVVYVSNDGTDYALWMDGGRDGTFLARRELGIMFDGVPATYEGYDLITSNRERTNALTFLQTIPLDYFGEEGDTVGVINTRMAGRPYILRYEYDEATDTLTDLFDGTVYTADGDLGLFLPEGGGEDSALSPGYRVSVGLDNYAQLFDENETLGDTLLTIFIWNVVFAVLSVFTTFVAGLFMAIVLDDPNLFGKKIIRSLLIVPYAIPGVISILVWQGLMNSNLGLLTSLIEDGLGITPRWFSDANTAKFAVIMVNLWLGYPYMMLICSGALQAIPRDIYEAASVDGAQTTAKFWNITLPLLLVTVGPLLIASFTYNFNNYLIIEALTEGNPVIEGASTPAGHTDLLINYTYNLAFGAGRGADYGYASAITIVIFAMVAVVTMFNYRFTQTWEEVGENV